MKSVFFRYLHSVLVKNEQVTENNRKLLVECLRAIAEILIWGDQNDSTVFDFFLERQMLSYFLSIMKQNCGSYVCVQLLQTLNILFENIRHKTSLSITMSIQLSLIVSISITRKSWPITYHS
ncbi:unnamed protein product [Gongylonema pulchrum]|uniref:FPL domain-containing protein n=1 Tax=Gongylonema pulchrum TaxID=637853 RepID=A0A183DX44_9BILA|nr:unnamed protein product [Gongylonema pulchrum]